MGAFIAGFTMNRGEFLTSGLQGEGIKHIDSRSGMVGLVPGMTRGVPTRAALFRSRCGADRRPQTANPYEGWLVWGSWQSGRSL